MEKTKKEMSLYNNLLTYNGYISVYDEEFESSLSFDVDLQEFISSYQEFPEYFTDEMIITLYHLSEPSSTYDLRRRSEGFPFFRNGTSLPLYGLVSVPLGCPNVK